MAKDYYKILGLGKSATADEIKRAYRKLAQLYHPDKGGDPQKFKEINEAYQVLSDPEKRSQYDQFGQTFEQAQRGGGFSGFSGFRDFSSFAQAFGGGRAQGFGGFEDIFSEIFGGRAGGFSNQKRGRDISVDLEITLEEAAEGVDKKLNLFKTVICDDCRGTGAAKGSQLKKCLTCRGTGQVERKSRAGFFSFSQVSVCPDCQGRGETPEKKCSACGGDGRVKKNVSLSVKIPAGINDGQIISLQGQGESMGAGRLAGDLYLNIHVRPHPIFERKGNDLYQRKEISFAQAVLGDKIEIESLFKKVLLKIPSGIESGDKMKIKGQGMPRLHGRGKGDMIVEIKIKTPKKVSSRVKKALEEIKEEL